jgi:hypothetical protein
MVKFEKRGHPNDRWQEKWKEEEEFCIRGEHQFFKKYTLALRLAGTAHRRVDDGHHWAAAPRNDKRITTAGKVFELLRVYLDKG